MSHSSDRGSLSRRPLPLPMDSSQQSRRALPTPPTPSAAPRNDIPPSRSRRALPPVPGSQQPPPPENLSSGPHQSIAQDASGNLSTRISNTRMHAPRPIPPQTADLDIGRESHRIPSQAESANGDRTWYTTGRETPTQENWSTPDVAGTAYDFQPPRSVSESSPKVMLRQPELSSHELPSRPSPSSVLYDAPRSSSNHRRDPSEPLQFPEPHPRRQLSTRSSLRPSTSSINRSVVELSPSWNDQSQPPSAWVERKLQIHQSHRPELYDDESVFRPESQYEDEDEWDEEEDVEVDESRFFNRALLSEMAVQVKDKVVMGRHTKAGIAWVGSFTGKDVVVSAVLIV